MSNKKSHTWRNKPTRPYLALSLKESDAFREAHFEQETQSIVITFHNGYRYRYGMDQLFEKFAVAESAGKFFHQFIRPLPASRLENAKESK